jgi:putative peptidoglycan lipid II flippase
LNAFKRFTSFALAPVLYNLGIIFGIVVLTPRYGLMGLAYGVVFGAFLHLAIQIPSVVKVGFRYRRIIDFGHAGVRKIGALMIPRTIGLAVNQVDLLVNTIIASTLVAGSITVYNFANNLQNFPINVFGVSLAIAAFPVLSEAFAENDRDKFVRQFSETVRRILYLMIPISILFLLLRAQIVRVVLGANAYSWEATYLTAQMLGIFALSLFAQSLIPTLARSFYAHHDTKTPVKIAIASVIVDISLALYLSRKYGVLGLAGAYSVANLLNMFLLYYFLRRKFGSLDDTRVVRSGLKIVFASILMGAIVVGMKYFLALGVNMRTFVGIFIQGLVAGTVGLLSYFFLTLLLRCEEVVMIRDWILRIWNKIRNGKPPAQSEPENTTNERN